MVALGVALGCAVPAAHASLSVPTGGPSTQFTDSRTADAVANFAAAIGGADNGATSGEHGSGFRHVSWDDIALNGSDPGSTALPGGHTVALSRGRLQPWGIELGSDVAVADDGFHSVNSNVQFTPYSLHDVWAPFNSPVAELDVVAPDGQASTPVAAQTRGLGVVFLNVRQADTTGIEYYNGDILLGRVFAPAGNGGPSFAGLLFPDPVVTRVVVVLGTAEIFSLDGSPAGTDPNTMVAGDDVTLAEPAAARGAVAATAGVPVNAALDTFTETDPNASPKALIDWGDGVRSVGTIVPGPTGTFLVAGNHAYAHTGSYVADVTVDDSSGPEQTKEINIAVGPRTTTTAVTCSPSPVAVSASTTCTATISDATGAGASSPTGVVSFSTTTPGAAFGQGEGCLLGPTAITGVSSCAVQFTPGLLPPSQAHVAAAYGGDSAHAASTATTSVGVRPQRCSLRALSRRVRPRGLGVLVTCDARSGVQISVMALVARKGRLKAFRLQFGTLRSSVTAGRPTVLSIKPAAGVLPALHAALRRHQHVSLKLTLTASSHATTRTTTTRVSALRVSALRVSALRVSALRVSALRWS